MQLIHLHPLSAVGTAFHIGSQQPDTLTTLIHSDTLTAAVTATAARLWGGGSSEFQILSLALTSGNLRVSSAFPCLRHPASGKVIRFLPKPMHLDLQAGDHLKQWNRIHWLSWEAWRQARSVKAILPMPRFGSAFAVTAEELPLAFQEELRRVSQSRPAREQEGDMNPQLPGFSEVILRSHNAVHKVLREDAYYTQPRWWLQQITPSKGGQHEALVPGLWAILQGEDLHPAAASLFRTAFHIMAHDGMGGERSTGCGQFHSIAFEPLPAELMPALNQDAPHQMTLSLCRPATAEEFSKFTHYRLLRRGGAKRGFEPTHPMSRRQATFLISEGSILASTIQGSHIDLSPPGHPHPVWRFGFAVSIALPSPTI